MRNNNSFGQMTLWEIVGGFYRARSLFHLYYERHRNGDSVGYQEINHLVGNIMSPLEKAAHSILTRATGDSREDLESYCLNGVLEDLLHEANDLRLAVNRVNELKPKIEDYRKKNGNNHDKKTLVEELLEDIRDAEERITRKYEEVKGLFDKATRVLEQTFLPVYRDNMPLLKSMILKDNSDIFMEDGSSRLPIIFGYMFADGAFEAYYTAGADWLRHYQMQLAISAFNKASDFYEQRKSNPDFVQRNRPRLTEVYAKLQEFAVNHAKYRTSMIGAEVSDNLTDIKKLVERMEQYVVR